MNETIKKANNHIKTQKKAYLVLGLIIIFGIIIGSVYVFLLNDNDNSILVEEIRRFFEMMKDINHLSYGSSFINSIISNLLYVISIWLLGISIIGLPIILFLLMMKGFIFGFSCTSIISIYGFKGVFGALAYIFPHQLILLPIGLLLSFYAVSFSVKLFSYLFFKKNINFKETMHRYIRILFISLSGVVLASLCEIFLNPFLIQLFTKII